MENEEVAGALGPVEVNYTVADTFAATFQAAHRHAIRILIFAATITAVLILVAIILDGDTLTDAVRWFPWTVVLVLVACLLAFDFTIFPLIAHALAWRRKGLQQIRFELCDEGVRVETKKGTALIYWSALKRVSANQQRLFLFVTSTSALVLPRRAFPDHRSFEAMADQAATRFARNRGGQVQNDSN